MSNKRFTLFAVITLALVIAAVVSSYQRAPQTQVEKAPLLANLMQQINSVSSISIRDKEFHTEIIKHGDQWLLKNRDGYPVIFDKVKDLVVSLANLQVLEGKTRNPDLYTRLDVEGTESAPGKSILVSLTDENGNQMTSLVIGKQRATISNANQAPSRYVRRADEERALLVEGAVNIKADPSRWMNNMLFDIKAALISDITIDHADGTQLHLSRSKYGSGELTLHDIEEGFQLKSKASLNGLVTALEELRFQDVVATKNFKTTAAEKTVTQIKTFDGITLTATIYAVNSKYYAQFIFNYQAPENPVEGSDPAQVENFVKQMQALSGWTYEIPTFKANMLTREKKTLLRSSAPIE